MPKILAVGDTIPEFSLLDQNGIELSIKTKLGKPLIVYFYPKDDTPGCIKEACYFQDQYEVFAEHGADIIGISNDSPKSHLAFAQKYNLNFTLLSDKGRKVEKLFGVPRTVLGLLPGRVTFVIDATGVIKHVFKSQFKTEKHVDEAIKIIKTF